jgi:hypothetical protein
MLFNGRKDLEGPSRAPRAGIGELARLSKAVQSVVILLLSSHRSFGCFQILLLALVDLTPVDHAPGPVDSRSNSVRVFKHAAAAQ